MPDHTITTLLIEDSGLMRIVLSDTVRRDPELKLLGTANNGQDGLAKIQNLQPNVIVTDMVMPECDGLDVVKTVMRVRPTPVILLSSLAKGHPKVFEALSAGAFDFLNKEEVAALAKQDIFPLNELIKVAGQVSTKKLERQDIKKNTHTHSFDQKPKYEIIAVGASTGGPSAIETLLCGLPANLNIPVVIAQHMPEQFLISFTKRLAKITPLRVKIAERNEALQGGTVYIAPGHTNTQITREAITNRPVFDFTTQQYQEFNHPSINSLFVSLAEVYQEKAIGVVLTGMGRDGTKGLDAIQRRQGFTIVQDEPSSIVYGMPKSAIEHGVAQQVLRMKEMPGFLVSCLS